MTCTRRMRATRSYLFEGEVDVAYKHFKEGYKSDQTHKALKHEYKRLKKYNKIKGCAHSAPRMPRMPRMPR